MLLFDLNPSLIVHTRPFNGYKSSDGLAGALTHKGEYIVTTPNSESVFIPPLGHRHVSLKIHLRFGEDDPLEWPQLYHPELPHLACIAIPPQDDNDPMSIMWDTPKEVDFIKEAPVFVGIKQLRHSKFCQLVVHIQRLQSHCHNLFPPMINTIPLIPRLLSFLDNFLHKVKFSQSDRHMMCLCIRECQRAFLELQACVDYLVIYKPSMERGMVMNVEPELRRWEFRTVACKVRGAFTFDPAVCEMLYHARIPVWLIRPSTQLKSIRIMSSKKAEPCIPPLSGFPLLMPPNPPIFEGPENSLGKYEALENHVYNLQAPDRWGI